MDEVKLELNDAQVKTKTIDEVYQELEFFERLWCVALIAIELIVILFIL